MTQQQQLKFTDYPHPTGPNILIIHGLLGSKDNWRSISKHLSQHYRVICVDCRNHGESFHHPDMNYATMATDILALIKQLKLTNVHIIGHSMGGKIAMKALQLDPQPFQSSVIVDIAPKNYNHHHAHVLEAMQQTNLTSCTTRTDIDTQLSVCLPNDQATRQLLLKNITRNPDTQAFSWKCNVGAIISNYPSIMQNSLNKTPISIPTLSIAGETSSYVTAADHATFKHYFTNITFSCIPHAGHWVQAEAPEAFLNTLIPFIEKNLQTNQDPLG